MVFPMNLEKDESRLPLPEVGQIVQVRTRKFLVDKVEYAPSGGSTVVGLLCLDDDAQGKLSRWCGSWNWRRAFSIGIFGNPSAKRDSTIRGFLRPTCALFVGTV
jgi:hypothetical protein